MRISTAAIGVAMLGAAGSVIAAAPADAHYPSRPIRWIVPVPAGSSGDFVTRIVTQKIGEKWGQQIIIDNRAGGSAIIGSDIIAKASPDGYTFGTLLTSCSQSGCYQEPAL
ncbi:MAG: hypothetical protein JWN94_191 [Betaproteobacteria bacterium]|nr:hypothetical protein [Betaproteobacteria bacterium]